MKFSALYLLSIVAINIGFVHVPLINGWPPMSIAVGLVFVLRDFAQREIGHRVLLLMLVGAVLSYFMASPAVALASCAAYLFGELADWWVYTYTKRPLHQRVLLSSLASAPLDSFVFLAAIDHLTPHGLALMTASKLVCAGLVFAWLRAQQPQGEQSNG